MTLHWMFRAVPPAPSLRGGMYRVACWARGDGPPLSFRESECAKIESVCDGRGFKALDSCAPLPYRPRVRDTQKP